MAEETRKIKVTRLGNEPSGAELQERTPAERIGMVWQLTVDAYAFRGEKLAESRLPRHAVRILRRDG